MNQSDQPGRTFKQQFAIRKRRQLIVTGLLLASFAMVVISPQSPADDAFRSAKSTYVVFAAGALLFSMWNWRCPACNRYLGREVSPNFCSKCGAHLR